MSTTGGAALTPGTPFCKFSQTVNAAITVVIPAVPGQTNYVTGFEVSLGGATAEGQIAVTLTNTIAGTTLVWYMNVPADVNGVNELIVEFPQPVPASGPNVGISLTVAAAGVGNTHQSAIVHGFTV